MTEKICTVCAKTKPLSEYSLKKDGRNGLMAHCKACDTEKKRAYHLRTYHIRKREINHRNAKTLAIRREQSPRVSFMTGIKAALKRRPSSNPITTNYLMMMWEKQNGKCALSGIPMTWSKGKSNGAAQPFSMSIDRIDNHRPYDQDNVRLICNCINMFRGNMTDDELMPILKAFYEFQFNRHAPIIFGNGNTSDDFTYGILGEAA